MTDPGILQYNDISGKDDFLVKSIQDSEVKPMAQQKSFAGASLPAGLFLMPSALGLGKLGVYTAQKIEERVVFGPFKGKRIATREISAETDYCNSWDVIKTGSTEAHYTIDASDEQNSNWMRFVNCARDENEQNLVSFQHHGDIYYRTCKAIESGNELLVWYDESVYSKKAPIHQPGCFSPSRGGHRFVCTNCKLVFLGPSYLYRHKQHRCQTARLPCDPDSLSPPDETRTDSSTPSSATDSVEKISERATSNKTNTVPIQSSGYQCSQCDKRCKTSKRLREHFHSAHTNGFPFKCYFCGEGFKDFVSRKEHVELHKAEQKFKCCDCRKSFIDISALNLHHCRAGGVSTKPKTIPHKSFNRRDCLQTHQDVHSEVRHFSSEICGKQNTRRSSLSKHKEVHTDQPNDSQQSPQRCNVCDKVFSRASSLRVHQRIHTGEKPYKCKQCNRRFAQSSTLAGHQRTHADEREKPFRCSDCGKCFARVADFHIHQSIHTGEKPFKCNFCEKRFRLNSSLSKHRQVHLSDEKRVEESQAGNSKLWKCSYCDKIFTVSSNLRRHERTHTKEERHPCTDCNKSYSRKDDLERHLRKVHPADSHQHECWVCGKMLASYQKMKLHICLHTGERPHSCSVCEKGYISLKSYRRHLRSHQINPQ